MPACISASGATAFKNNFRFKYRGGYTVSFKKRDRQIRNAFNRIYFINGKPKGIYIFFIEDIIPVLKEKYF